MTRIVAAILVVAALAVALAVTVCERRVQAAFDAVRQESEGQLERVDAMARLSGLVEVAGGQTLQPTAPTTPARAAAARVELEETLASLRPQLRQASRRA